MTSFMPASAKIGSCTQMSLPGSVPVSETRTVLEPRPVAEPPKLIFTP
jgi:hypothetical protein